MSTSVRSSVGVDPKMDPSRKAKSNDPGWKYGWWPDLSDKNMVQCILCDKKCKGGIRRLKEHLVGGFRNVSKCPNTTTAIAREMHRFMAKKKTSKPQLRTFEKNKGLNLRKAESASSQIVDERRRIKGPNERTAEDRKRVKMHVDNFLRECGIPSIATHTRSFERMVEAIGRYGPGLKPPTPDELRALVAARHGSASSSRMSDFSSNDDDEEEDDFGDSPRASCEGSSHGGFNPDDDEYDD